MPLITKPVYIPRMAFDSQDSLFSAGSADTPLALRARPQDFSEVVGQTHFLNDRFKKLLLTDRWCGFIFWARPAQGKQHWPP